MKSLIYAKFLVFTAVLCVAFNAFSIETFVVPVAENTVTTKNLIKLNNSSNHSFFQHQINDSSLFVFDNEEIEEDMDGDDNHLDVDVNICQKSYCNFKIPQKNEVYTSNIRKKIFSESIPIFIQFRNFRL